MLSRADLNKKFYTISKDGKQRILTLTESIWTRGPCFTDGEEYYYLDGSGYEDDIIAYWPCEKSHRGTIRLIIAGLILFFFWYCIGSTVKNINENVTEVYDV